MLPFLSHSRYPWLVFTLFTIPKAFADHIGVIQRNAIGSWARLQRENQPRPEIILFGNDPGTAEISRELGL